MAETDILISVLSHFLGEGILHSGLCEFHSCALCRGVSHHGLITKVPLSYVYLRCYFGHYPRFKIIGKDRHKDRFKNWQLCCAGQQFVICCFRERSPPVTEQLQKFCDHRTIKLMKNCVIFSNPSISLIAPPSVTRKYHHYVLEFLHLLQCIPLTCSIHCLWFVERHTIPQ